MNYCLRTYSCFKKSLILTSLLFFSVFASAVTFTVPSSDTDGTFTMSWSGIGTYVTIDEKNGSTYSNIWGSSSNGSHTITRPNGTYTYRLNNCTVTGSQYGTTTTCNYAPEKSISVIINSTPKVNPTEPSDNATFNISQSVSAFATAIANAGVSQVEFKLNSGSWSADNSSPYAKNFGQLSTGSHTIHYRAKDSNGGYSTIVTRSLVVTSSITSKAIEYQYDALGRLKEVTIDSVKKHEYTYDDAGNRKDVKEN